MIGLVDYGAGNVRSVHKALEFIGAEVQLVREPASLSEVDKVILPGVGAFGDCMSSLTQTGLAHALFRWAEQGRPLLGICVGMQVLFDEGEELGTHAGQGLLPGCVTRFAFPACSGEGKLGLKIPHTGWNQIESASEHALLAGLPPGAWAYFNHAYYCQAGPAETLAVTDYGGSFPSIAGRGPLCAVQFHPEKSQDVGLRILRNFVELVE